MRTSLVLVGIALACPASAEEIKGLQGPDGLRAEVLSDEISGGPTAEGWRFEYRVNGPLYLGVRDGDRLWKVALVTGLDSAWGGDQDLTVRWSDGQLHAEVPTITRQTMRGPVSVGGFSVSVPVGTKIELLASPSAPSEWTIKVRDQLMNKQLGLIWAGKAKSDRETSVVYVRAGDELPGKQIAAAIPGGAELAVLNWETKATAVIGLAKPPKGAPETQE